MNPKNGKSITLRLQLTKSAAATIIEAETDIFFHQNIMQQK